ncbi:MAG: MBL fold metallo-hydrolase [Myxococcota bacterium]
MTPEADELTVGGLTLRGVACGGVQTCLMVPELRLMFDIAPGVAGHGKFHRILVSHGHHDHLGGLPYLASQRRMTGGKTPVVHAPAELIAPFGRVLDAWQEIEGHELTLELHGHHPGDTVSLGPKMTARCVRSVHRIPSLCWVVRRTVHRLDERFAALPGPELAKLREAGERITRPHQSDAIAVSGDTQIDMIDREPWLWDVDVLVHEVTGWDDRRSVEQVRKWGHTHVDEMIERAERFTGKALVLVHRSARHSRRSAERVVAERFPASVRDRVHIFG